MHSIQNFPSEGNQYTPVTMPATFANCVRLEPRLANLLRECQSYHVSPPASYCQFGVFFGEHDFPRPAIKDRLIRLVGWEREDMTFFAQLGTSKAYDICYRALFDALPACKCCGGEQHSSD